MAVPPPGVPLFDEAGALSREYLLHRGFCCGNGCRNCPYHGLESGVIEPNHQIAGERSAVSGIRRIVSLAPSNTEILHALGALDRLIGVDDWSDWPPEVTELPRVGPDLDVRMEAVEALEPDLVLASLSVPGMEKNVERLQKRGIPHLVLNQHSLGEIWAAIREVAQAIDAEERAEAVVSGLHDRIQAVRRLPAILGPTPRVYWEWWPRPLFAPGGWNWLTAITELAGGMSVTGQVEGYAARPAPEEIVAARPDVICLVWTGVASEKVRPEVVRRRPGWYQIPAVQEGRIHVLDEGLFCRPSPRLVDGLEMLAGLLRGEPAAESATEEATAV